MKEEESFSKVTKSGRWRRADAFSLPLQRNSLFLSTFHDKKTSKLDNAKIIIYTETSRLDKKVCKLYISGHVSHLGRRSQL
jgi:hypothetical protein